MFLILPLLAGAFHTATNPELADPANRRVLNRVWRGVKTGKRISRDDLAHLRSWLDEIEVGLA